jgi:hypothetical protein
LEGEWASSGKEVYRGVNELREDNSCRVLWTRIERTAHEKSMDQKEPAYEHVAERSQCCVGLGAQPHHRAGKTPSDNHDVGWRQAGGPLLERRFDRRAAPEEKEIALAGLQHTPAVRLHPFD